MDSRKFIYRETAVVALGQVIGSLVMVGVFALLHRLDGSVFLGAAIGGVVATANFFVMAICADLAADKAEAQDVKGGQALMRRSQILRLGAMALVLFAAAKSGWCNIFALVLPLVFVRPALTLGEFFRKSGDKGK